MSTVITKNLQVGADGTASNNFTIYQPVSPDGTLRIGNGNTGTTSAQIVLNSTGNVGFRTASPTAPVTVGRVDSSNEGGQIDLCRASDNASAWAIDVFGNTSTPTLRIINGATVAASVDGSNNFAFNSGYGSAAVAYGCRAWVNFNGTGTVAIRASGNVSSITDNGTGDYTVNFTTAMPDTNYSIAGLSQNNGTSPPSAYLAIGPGGAGTSTNFLLTTSARVSTGVYGVGGSTDSGYVTVAIFR